MKRRVIVVDGPLAFRMRRLEAAHEGDLGLEILTLPLLSARLAGGFCRSADRDVISPAIGAALETGGFKEIENARVLPGMVRAVMQTLDLLYHLIQTFHLCRQCIVNSHLARTSLQFCFDAAGRCSKCRGGVGRCDRGKIGLHPVPKTPS